MVLVGIGDDLWFSSFVGTGIVWIALNHYCTSEPFFQMCFLIKGKQSNASLLGMKPLSRRPTLFKTVREHNSGFGEALNLSFSWQRPQSSSARPREQAAPRAGGAVAHGPRHLVRARGDDGRARRRARTPASALQRERSEPPLARLARLSRVAPATPFPRRAQASRTAKSRARGCTRPTGTRLARSATRSTRAAPSARS